MRTRVVMDQTKKTSNMVSFGSIVAARPRFAARRVVRAKKNWIPSLCRAFVRGKAPFVGLSMAFQHVAPSTSSSNTKGDDQTTISNGETVVGTHIFTNVLYSNPGESLVRVAAIAPAVVKKLRRNPIVRTFLTIGLLSHSRTTLVRTSILPMATETMPIIVDMTIKVRHVSSLRVMG